MHIIQKTLKIKHTDKRIRIVAFTLLNALFSCFDVKFNILVTDHILVFLFQICRGQSPQIETERLQVS